MRTINNFTTELTASLATGATSAFIPAAFAAIIDALVPSAADPIVLTLENGADIEIILVTAANGTTGELTIVREQEGTTSPATFAASTEVESRETALMVNPDHSYNDYGDSDWDTYLDMSIPVHVVNLVNDPYIHFIDPPYSELWETTFILINSTGGPLSIMGWGDGASIAWDGPSINSVGAGEVLRINFTRIAGGEWLAHYRVYS